MSVKMEMSLDDIIEQNKKNKPRHANKTDGNKAGSNKCGGRTSTGSPRKGGAVRYTGSRKPASGSGDAGVMRPRNHGGITRNRSSGGFSRSSNPKAQAFLDAIRGTKFGGGETTKLIVSNLYCGVTDSDIIELFSVFGPLKSAGVHYDRFGRSLGSAVLIFERKSDAIKAMQQYNGVPLDGCVMNIQLATSEIPGISQTYTAGFSRPSSRLGGHRLSAKPNTNHGGRGSADAGKSAYGKSVGGKVASGKAAGSKAARSKKTPKKLLTAEELDAELDEYVKSMVCSDGA